MFFLFSGIKKLNWKKKGTAGSLTDKDITSIQQNMTELEDYLYLWTKVSSPKLYWIFTKHKNHC